MADLPPCGLGPTPVPSCFTKGHAAMRVPHWAPGTDRGCELRAGAPAAGSREEAAAPKVGLGATLSPTRPLNPEKQAAWQRTHATQTAGSAGSLGPGLCGLLPRPHTWTPSHPPQEQVC